LLVTVGAESHTYNFTATGLSWGPVTVSMADFPSMVVGGSYTATLQVSYPVAFPIILGDTVNINWNPAGAPPPPPGNLIITDSKTSHLYYYKPTPGFGTAGTVNDLTNKYVYKMGAVINGYIDITPINPWRVELRRIDGLVVDAVNMATGSKYFTIGTGNVSYDGEYRVYAVVNGVDYAYQTVFIQYNLTWGAKTLKNCAGTQTISGWITRGSGQTVLVPVVVSIAYPDNKLAGYYTVAPNSSGQFTITFPADGPDSDTEADIGYFRVYLSDGYDPANADNDAMIYDILNNIPSYTLTLAPYINPTLIYKNQDNQPILLVVKEPEWKLCVRTYSIC